MLKFPICKNLMIQYFMSNNQKTWGALHKAWRGYAIAKNKYEYDNMKYYAAVIQKLQHELGLPVSSFHDIALSASRLLNCCTYTDR